MSRQVAPSLARSPVMFASVRRIGAEIANVNAVAVLVDGSGSRDEQYRHAIQVDAHPPGELDRLWIMECLVQDGAIGDRAFADRRVRDGLEDILKSVHRFATGFSDFGFQQIYCAFCSGM
jgi:hypothetical protein